MTIPALGKYYPGFFAFYIKSFSKILAILDACGNADVYLVRPEQRIVAYVLCRNALQTL